MVVHRRIILALLVSPVLMTGAEAGELRDDRNVDIAPVLESSRSAGLDVQPEDGRRGTGQPPPEWSMGSLVPPAPRAADSKGLRLSFGAVEDRTPMLLRPDGEDSIGGMIQFSKSLP